MLAAEVVDAMQNGKEGMTLVGTHMNAVRVKQSANNKERKQENPKHTKLSFAYGNFNNRSGDPMLSHIHKCAFRFARCHPLQ